MRHSSRHFTLPSRRPSAFALTCAILAASAPAYAQSVSVSNFSFETPSTSSYIADPSGASWAFSNGGGHIAGIAQNSLVGAGTAPNGSQIGFIQSTSSMSQAISGFTTGSTYQITVAAAQRPNYPTGSFNITVNGTVVASITPASSSYAYYTATFTATGTTQTIAFVGTVLAANEINLDSVQISQVQSISVPNFSFETPSTSTYVLDPSGASWTFTNGGGHYSGVAQNSVVGSGNAPNGSQVGFVQSSSGISQTLSGFTSGVIYQVTVAGAQRPNYTASSFNITVNGSSIANITPSSSTYADYTATFTATSSSATIGFVGTGGANTEINLDNVRINSFVANNRPLNVTIDKGDQETMLTWSPVAGATAYNVYRSTTSGSGYTLVTTPSATSNAYLDSHLTNGTTYYYMVTALVPGYSESGYSTEVSAVPVAQNGYWNLVFTPTASSATPPAMTTTTASFAMSTPGLLTATANGQGTFSIPSGSPLTASASVTGTWTATWVPGTTGALPTMLVLTHIVSSVYNTSVSSASGTAKVQDGAGTVLSSVTYPNSLSPTNNLPTPTTTWNTSNLMDVIQTTSSLVSAQNPIVSSGSTIGWGDTESTTTSASSIYTAAYFANSQHLTITLPATNQSISSSIYGSSTDPAGTVMSSSTFSDSLLAQ